MPSCGPMEGFLRPIREEDAALGAGEHLDDPLNQLLQVTNTSGTVGP